jgi:hypothetical protein
VSRAPPSATFDAIASPPQAAESRRAGDLHTEGGRVGAVPPPRIGGVRAVETADRADGRIVGNQQGEPCHGLRVRDAVSVGELVHASGVVLAEVEQLVLQETDEDRHLTVRVVGGLLTVGARIDHGDAVDLQLRVGERDAEMMLAPGVVRPLDVGRGVKHDRVVVGVALHNIVAGGVTERAGDRHRDVALAAWEELLLGGKLVPEGPGLERLAKLVALVEVEI